MKERNNNSFRINPKANLRLILIDKSLEDADKEEEKVIKLIYPKLTHMDYNIGAALHLASKGEGILFQEKETEKVRFIYFLLIIFSTSIFNSRI